jgi:hypothetical protein
MALTFRDQLRSKWHVFRYNFKWPDFVWLLDNWIVRLTVAVPIIGYLILFNDGLSNNLTFNSLANEGSLQFGLSGATRLKLLYLGLLTLGLANCLFRVFRPSVMKLGDDQHEYVSNGLKHFTFITYLSIHDRNRHSGYDAKTLHGKYYDSEWDEFERVAVGEESPSLHGSRKNPRSADWNVAKLKYENLLRSILIENYFQRVTSKRVLLCCIVVLAASGYLLLAIPSCDILLKVLYLIASDLLV